MRPCEALRLAFHAVCESRSTSLIASPRRSASRALGCSVVMPRARSATFWHSSNHDDVPTCAVFDVESLIRSFLSVSTETQACRVV